MQFLDLFLQNHARTICEYLGCVVVLCPILLFMCLGGASLIGNAFSERPISKSVKWTVFVGLSAALTILILMVRYKIYSIPILFGDWVVLRNEAGQRIYEFEIKFIFDRLSVPFVILTFVLFGTIGAFASRYMHRERGFNRFFVFYALFMQGMIITSLSGSIETLFAGWEMVGLSSAMLVAFFHERPSPVANGLRVWTVYRISDAALLIASVFIHIIYKSGDFEQFLGTGDWPFGKIESAAINPQQAFLLGSLLLLAAAGKSALIPFSGWLPRAMEGPTPSSAVFYGALSVHLGAFLLLRLSPLIEQSWLLCGIIVVLGLSTAIFAAFAERVQTDIKCSLSFASLTQVGIIVAEIGLGFRYLALIHILGHGCFRTLQFVRAPTLLHDYHSIENAIGIRISKGNSANSVIPERWRLWLYRLAIERGYLDATLNDYVVGPTLRFLRKCDALERRWTEFLSGRRARPTDAKDLNAGRFEKPL